MMLLPMLGGLGSVIMVATYRPGPMGYVIGGMFLLTMGGFVGVTVWRNINQRKTRVTDNRRTYLRYLTKIRRQVRTAAAQQRHALTWRFPAPEARPFVAAEHSRVWNYGTEDDEFLLVRYGTGPQELALRLVPPESDAMDQLDPVAASSLHRLLKTHRVQPDLPSTLLLPGFARIELTGPDQHARGLARSIITSAALAMSPEHFMVAVIAGPDSAADWEWVKWLPHAHSPVADDAVGPARLVVGDAEDLLALLPEDLPNRGRFIPGSGGDPTLPHLLIVVDGGRALSTNALLPDEGLQGITVLELPEVWDELTDPTRLRLHLDPGATSAPDRPGDEGDPPMQVSAVRPRMAPVSGHADLTSVAVAEAMARRLTPWGEGRATGEGEVKRRTPELTELLGQPDVRDFEAPRAWRPRPDRDQLRVPLGVDMSGAPVHLDIKESAQQGMGPHGLVIGATGSGKSELLRTLVLGLAMSHSSEKLNFVLVDFKGGATFAGMAGMPHVSAIITNVSEELSLVDRMQDALSGEMVRRQELLRKAGNYQSIRDYEKARASGAKLQPLPSLMIVCDEFSELLAAKPEFADLFVAIGRLGRSLGIHLLLSSQRLEEGKLRGLDSHLSYRIGLRTFSGQESRTVLGVPDAYELPPIPGRGYPKADGDMVEFQSAYVSGPPPMRDEEEHQASTTPAELIEVLPFRAAPVLADSDDRAVDASDAADAPDAEHIGELEQPPAPSTTAPSTFDLAVRAMAGQGPEAHQVWLPPLDVPETFDRLTGDLRHDRELGLISHRWRSAGALTFPIGIVDVPKEQRREVAVADLSGARGHVGVVGAPRTGRSTLLRSVVTGLCLTRTPLEAQVYVLDFGGGTFTSLAGLPHMAGIATRSEPDVVRRIVAEVSGIIEAREQMFRREGIDSIETYRERRAAGEVDDGYGDVFLIVDGWATLRSDYENVEAELGVLLQRALTYGVHFVTSANRWMDFRTGVRDVLATRFELRLGDPLDSEIDRKASANIPSGRAGRGLDPSRLHFLAALPRIDGHQDPDSLRAGTDHLVRELQAAWTGPTAPKLRLLPERITLEELRQRAGAATIADSWADPGDHKGAVGPAGPLLLGIDERALAPVSLDIESDPHLLVYGDGRSEKSTLLRGYLHEVMRTRSPRQAQVFLVDYRRAHLSLVPEEYLHNYSSNAEQAEQHLTALANFLTRRLPGEDITPQQLRERSWWTGPDAFVVVDDYELVATQMSNPLAALQPLMAQARDVGLHLVIARRAAGSSRGFDNLLSGLKDLAQPCVILSGDPGEGPIIGDVRAGRQPAGRGRLTGRDSGYLTIQTAWSDPVV